MSYSFLEVKLREALVAHLKAKDNQNGPKEHKGAHAFNQFWLQLPKLQEGFQVLKDLLEDQTGNREGPLHIGQLLARADDFGLPPHSPLLDHICNEAPGHRCSEIDHVGLALIMLVVHLSEPGCSAGLDPHVRLMLASLESAFAHFQSARNGRLDKREVTEALQHESAKAHAKEGREGRTSHRLAARLFEGLEWSQDNTISFERFLRGVGKLLKDEFEPDDAPDPLMEEFNNSRGNSITNAAGAGGAGPGLGLGARTSSTGAARASASGSQPKSILRKSESGPSK